MSSATRASIDAVDGDNAQRAFAIARFPGYGRLSRLDTREIKSGARVAQDDYTKENAQDFALWKAAKDEDEATGAGSIIGTGRGLNRSPGTSRLGSSAAATRADVASTMAAR